MVENPNQVTRSNIKCRLLVDVYPIPKVYNSKGVYLRGNGYHSLYPQANSFKG